MKKAHFLFLILMALLIAAALLPACGDDDDDDDDNDDDASDDDDDDDDSGDLPDADVTVHDAPDSNPLCRKVTVTTDVACSLSGYVTAALETGHGPSVPEASEQGTSHVFWFFGLIEDTTFDYTFYLAGQLDQVVAEGSFATDPLPAQQPVVTQLEFDGKATDADWYAVWAIDALTWGGVEYNWTLLYDRQGRIRFYHLNETEHAGWIEVMDNGDILYANREELVGLQPDGTEYTQVTVKPEDPYFVATHHQYYMEDLDADRAYVIFNKLGDGYQCDLTTPTETMVGDGVLEIDSDGNELWRWNIFEHQDAIPQTEMDPANCLIYYWGPQYPDWTHGNSVVPGPGEDEITISFRNVMRVIKVDKTTGDIVWQMGPDLDFEWIGDDPVEEHWFRVSHDVQWLSPTRMLIFDNGACRYQPLCVLGPWSRALELEVDEDNMTVEKVWEYRFSFALAQGNVDRNENGNTLIGTGGGKTTIEVTPEGDELFRMKFQQGNVRSKYYGALWSSQAPPSK